MKPLTEYLLTGSTLLASQPARYETIEEYRLQFGLPHGTLSTAHAYRDPIGPCTILLMVEKDDEDEDEPRD